MYAGLRNYKAIQFEECKNTNFIGTLSFFFYTQVIRRDHCLVSLA